MDKNKIICRCFKVSCEAIEDAVKSGAKTFEQVQDKTNCSTGCGCCKNDVIQVINEVTN